jgi:endonuclease/exonuclease/phosphatase family metal-dependent hydrolase
MNKSENLKADRYVTSECSVCGFPVVDTGINAYPSGYLEHTCSRCGLETRNLSHHDGGIKHTSLRKYDMVIGKTEGELINDLLSEIQTNSSKNILKVGSFNISKYNAKNRLAIKKAMRIVLENKLNICGIQEFVMHNDFNSLEMTKTPGAYNYTDYRESFTNGSAINGNGIVSHNPMYNTTGGKYVTKPGLDKCNPVENIYRQGYIKTTIRINNKDVSFYNTHFYYCEETVVKNQILELIDIIKKDNTPYKIVVGDFNHRRSDYYDLFTNIGLKLAFDIYDPNNNMQDGTRTVDNILYSSNIQLIDAYKVHTPDYATDHDLACAELKLL